MKKTPKLNSIGPFAAAAKNIETLANNLYFNTLYMQTLEQLMKAEKEYQAAVLEGDAIAIKETLTELNFIEEVMKLSAINYNNYRDSEVAKEEASD